MNRQVTAIDLVESADGMLDRSNRLSIPKLAIFINRSSFEASKAFRMLRQPMKVRIGRIRCTGEGIARCLLSCWIRRQTLSFWVRLDSRRWRLFSEESYKKKKNLRGISISSIEFLNFTTPQLELDEQSIDQPVDYIQFIDKIDWPFWCKILIKLFD